MVAPDLRRSIFSYINMSTFGVTLHCHHSLVTSVLSPIQRTGGRGLNHGELSMVLVMFHSPHLCAALKCGHSNLQLLALIYSLSLYCAAYEPVCADYDLH